MMRVLFKIKVHHRGEMRKGFYVMSTKPESNLHGTLVAVFIVAGVIIGMWGSIFLLFSSR
ncbi:Hypothetical protein Eab7_0570 [Exiguobacterium antarcticum B7]|nr:Hypothetical protein Eab7_0570 [Exiguobacterium antarcticum B7]